MGWKHSFYCTATLLYTWLDNFFGRGRRGFRGSKNLYFLMMVKNEVPVFLLLKNYILDFSLRNWKFSVVLAVPEKEISLEFCERGIRTSRLIQIWGFGKCNQNRIIFSLSQKVNYFLNNFEFLTWTSYHNKWIDITILRSRSKFCCSFMIYQAQDKSNTSFESQPSIRHFKSQH